MRPVQLLKCRSSDFSIGPDVEYIRRVDPCSIRNKLLLCVGLRGLQHIAPRLHRVPLRARQILVEPNIPVRDVYFIEHGIAGVVSRSKQHRPIEISMIGQWGLVGMPAVLGTNRSPFRCIVQIPGTALRMPAEDLQQTMENVPGFRQLLMNYVQARMVQQAQITVCNTRHCVSQRVARWLLMSLDRLEGDSVPVTHDLLGRSLGIRRAGVTVVISKMEAEGILRRARGELSILDREQLERSACHCYSFIRREYDRLLLPASDCATVPMRRVPLVALSRSSVERPAVVGHSGACREP
jgi:CRP-like cAMP-binding protein